MRSSQAELRPVIGEVVRDLQTLSTQRLPAMIIISLTFPKGRPIPYFRGRTGPSIGQQKPSILGNFSWLKRDLLRDSHAVRVNPFRG